MQCATAAQGQPHKAQADERTCEQARAGTGRHKRRGMGMADSTFLRAHDQTTRVKQHTPEKYAAIKHELDNMRPDTTKQRNAKRCSTRPATQGGAKSEMPQLAAAPFVYTRWSTNQWCDAQACGVAPGLVQASNRPGLPAAPPFLRARTRQCAVEQAK